MSKKFILPLLLLISTFAFSVVEAVPCKGCATLDFGKTLEVNLLQPMLNMTIEEKARYIQSFGVDLYKVADPDKAPASLGFLQVAPAARFAKYIKLFEEGVLGIYMTPSNFMYNVAKPTILFVESADDWTMIHEFSHFLFDRARMNGPLGNESGLANDSEDSQEDYFEARNKYKIWDAYVNEEHKQNTIQSFISYANVQMVFATTCEFEETTIEKMIRSIYIRHQPRGFSEKEFERSTRYIRKTSEKGIESLNFLLQDCELLAKTLSASDQDLKSSLEKTCEKVQKLKQEDLLLLKGLQISL